MNFLDQIKDSVKSQYEDRKLSLAEKLGIFGTIPIILICNFYSLFFGMQVDYKFWLCFLCLFIVMIFLYNFNLVRKFWLLKTLDVLGGYCLLVMANLAILIYLRGWFSDLRLLPINFLTAFIVGIVNMRDSGFYQIPGLLIVIAYTYFVG